ncbi:MAG: DUF2520 domain-containing protein [Ignavibacteriae bacterium]|nr:DUF2520 domain-containing protein [Ignavibacteriota bacterium]
MNKKVYIIGAGKVGSSLAFELKDKGYSIDFITDRNPDKLKRISSSVHPISYSEKIDKDFISGSQIIFICVQDRYIKDIISEISKFEIDFSDIFFILTSGSESSLLFNNDPKVFNKEKTGSMHPVQTFNKISYDNQHLLEKIYFGIEGGIESVDLMKQIIGALGSEFILIPAEKKYLYHSACVISSNFLVTLLNISSEVMGNLGIDKAKTFEIFKPIIENTLKNIGSDGLINSLTGPFDRNDTGTISNHLKIINTELPSLIPFYTLLGMETVKVAFKKESLSMKNVIALLDLMNEYIVKESDITNQTNS